MFTKLDRDEVLIAVYMHQSVSDISAQGRIQDGAKIGHRAPFLKYFFYRPEGYSNKPKAKQWFKSLWEEMLLFLVPYRSQMFDKFLKKF